MDHLRPILGSRNPVNKAATNAPTANIEPIQEPCSLVKGSGSVQLFVSGILMDVSLLQSTKKGRAGDDQPRPVPSPKAPIVARICRKVRY